MKLICLSIVVLLLGLTSNCYGVIKLLLRRKSTLSIDRFNQWYFFHFFFSIIIEGAIRSIAFWNDAT